MGGKEIPGTNGEIGAYIAKVSTGGCAEQMGNVVEGKNYNTSELVNLITLASFIADSKGLMKPKRCDK